MNEGRRPVGGIEMGGKASYCHQKTLQLKRDDGELTEVAVDELTQVETVSQNTDRIPSLPAGFAARLTGRCRG